MHKQKLKTDHVEKNVAMHFMNIKTPKINIVNLICSINNKKDFEKELFVKVRSTGKLLKAEVKIEGINAEVKLENKEIGISPGQACVFYSKNKIGDKVLGGGWIDSNYL